MINFPEEIWAVDRNTDFRVPIKLGISKIEVVEPYRDKRYKITLRNGMDFSFKPDYSDFPKEYAFNEQDIINYLSTYYDEEMERLDRRLKNLKKYKEKVKNKDYKY